MLQYTVKVDLNNGISLSVKIDTQDSLVTESMITLEAFKILSNEPNLNFDVNSVEKIVVGFEVVGYNED